MSAVVHIATGEALWNLALEEALAEEQSYELRLFEEVEAQLRAQEERCPQIAIWGYRSGLPAQRKPWLESEASDELPCETLVLVPSRDATAWEETCRELGPTHILSWPFEAIELRAKLASVLEKQRLQEEVRTLRRELAHRERALSASTRHAELTSRALEKEHDVLETATARLVESETLAAVGRVVSGIANEISNQLALVGYAEAIKSRVDERSDVYEFADAIVAAQTRLASMVDQIRSYASADLHVQEQEAASLNAVIDEALAIMRYDKRIKTRNIKRNYQAYPLVRLSHDPFAQVVINLLSNAARATQPGATIELSVRVEGEWAVLTVRDEGEGMSPEVLERLGEPFFTTQGDQGSGLGIGICMSIVREHGGSLRYRSEPGVGTTATVRIPILPAELGQESRG